MTSLISPLKDIFKAAPPPSSVLIEKKLFVKRETDTLLIVEYFWGEQSVGVWRTKNERLQEINTTKALHTHHVAMSGSHVLIMWNVCENKSEGRNEANNGKRIGVKK